MENEKSEEKTKKLDFQNIVFIDELIDDSVISHKSGRLIEIDKNLGKRSWLSENALNWMVCNLLREWSIE